MSESVAIVLDTNVALDLIVFADASTDALRDGLATGHLRWLATAPMRAEFARVLAYPALKLGADAIVTALAAFDRLSQPVPFPTPPRGLPQCRDPDDQGFLDLAVAAGAAVLYSRDRALLALAPALRKRHPGIRLAIRRPVDPPGPT